jgi:hypothetical protein
VEPGEKQILGGPVWVFASVLIYGTILLALYVLIDSLRPSRRASAKGRVPEPLWIYSAISVLFLGGLAVVQFVPGLQLAAAAPALATPIVLIAGLAYLLRVVFPKPDADALAASAKAMEEAAAKRAAEPVEPEEFDAFEDSESTR